jgi:hypothetical protein
VGDLQPALSSARDEGMTCQRGDPPESRSGGPILPFPQEKLSEDAALAGSDSDNVRLGSFKPVSCLGPFRRIPPLSDPSASAASEFFSQGKRDRSPWDGGPSPHSFHPAAQSPLIHKIYGLINSRLHNLP